MHYRPRRDPDRSPRPAHRLVILFAAWLFALPGIGCAQETVEARKAAEAASSNTTFRATRGTEHPFLWRIVAPPAPDQAAGKPPAEGSFRGWLYGTMHLGDARLVALPPAVDEALEQADALYCELALDKVEGEKAALVARMLLPRGERLADHLPEELYARLARYAQQRDLPMVTLDRMRVWATYLTLATLEAHKQGFTYSLDQEIYGEAKAADKEVGGLETMTEQIDALANSSEKDQVAMLGQTLDLMEKMRAEGLSPIRALLEVYLSGSLEALQAAADRAMGEDKELAQRMMKPLLEERNERMVARMQQKMTQAPETTFFFAIGAAHFPGEHGILAMLHSKGYRIERVGKAPDAMAAGLAAFDEVARLRAEAEQLRREIGRLESRLRAARRN